MNRIQSIVAAQGWTDQEDRLVGADEPLAQLQEACGGHIPGALAIPELLDLVQQCRTLGLRIAREFSAFDGRDTVTGFVRIHPVAEPAASDLSAPAGGCEIQVENWLNIPVDDGNSRLSGALLDSSDRAAAEVCVRLDAKQNIQFVLSHSSDAQEFVESIAERPGQFWSEYVDLDGISHQQPLHWRLLDGVRARIAGSERSWRVRLMPIGPSSSAPKGFELFLIAQEPLTAEPALAKNQTQPEPEHSRLIGSALTPVLRQPISRIIANAETIHSRLAGPLRDEYSEYASNIAAAGQHLSGMLDDLADLEVVEAPDFKTTKERVDLADVASRSAGILGVRAQSRDITVSVSELNEPLYAFAEFRRTLQILINLIGNAIAYSPEGSHVSVTISEEQNHMVSLTVSDHGPGVTKEQAERIFNKFERLGRDSEGGNDNGSGLGLFISRKLALAMEGNLEVLPATSDDELVGAEFRLTLPGLPSPT